MVVSGGLGLLGFPSVLPAGAHVLLVAVPGQYPAAGGGILLAVPAKGLRSGTGEGRQNLALTRGPLQWWRFEAASLRS